MRKRDELTNPTGCMFRAQEDEMTFVLLARDAAAPAAIRFWIKERIRLGKNTATDPQIIEAEACAQTMEAERTANTLSDLPMAVCSGCGYMGRVIVPASDISEDPPAAIIGCKCNHGLPPADDQPTPPATV